MPCELRSLPGVCVSNTGFPWTSDDRVRSADSSGRSRLSVPTVRFFEHRSGAEVRCGRETCRETSQNFGLNRLVFCSEAVLRMPDGEARPDPGIMNRYKAFPQRSPASSAESGSDRATRKPPPLYRPWTEALDRRLDSMSSNVVAHEPPRNTRSLQSPTNHALPSEGALA